MKPALRNKSKYTGIKRIAFSIKYSIDGLVYAYAHEKSLWIHGFLSIAAILVGLFLGISVYEWSIILISLGVILAFELVNTGMEACVDMVTTEFHPLAKIAKDCCSAASFVTSMIGAILTFSIFIPKIISLF